MPEPNIRELMKSLTHEEFCEFYQHITNASHQGLSLSTPPKFTPDAKVRKTDLVDKKCLASADYEAKVRHICNGIITRRPSIETTTSIKLNLITQVWCFVAKVGRIISNRWLVPSVDDLIKSAIKWVIGLAFLGICAWMGCRLLRDKVPTSTVAPGLALVTGKPTVSEVEYADKKGGTQMAQRPKPRLWITYAWADNDNGDFQYLVQELGTAGIQVEYDRIALIPGRRLWEQIAKRITKSDIDGWAMLLTEKSLQSEPCREELAYALQRALETKGSDFPLIGLLHGVSIKDVPLSLKVRLCLDMKNADWKEQVKASLENRLPIVSSQPTAKYVCEVIPNYGGSPSRFAVEMRPRFGEILHWRFLVPTSCPIVQWGHGPSGGGAINGMHTMTIQTSVNFNGANVNVIGTGDRLSPSVSGYVVFEGCLPEFVAFGIGDNPTVSLEIKEIEIFDVIPGK